MKKMFEKLIHLDQWGLVIKWMVAAPSSFALRHEITLIRLYHYSLILFAALHFAMIGFLIKKHMWKS